MSAACAEFFGSYLPTSSPTETRYLNVGSWMAPSIWIKSYLGLMPFFTYSSWSKETGVFAAPWRNKINIYTSRSKITTAQFVIRGHWGFSCTSMPSACVLPSVSSSNVSSSRLYIFILYIYFFLGKDFKTKNNWVAGCCVWTLLLVADERTLRTSTPSGGVKLVRFPIV